MFYVIVNKTVMGESNCILEAERIKKRYEQYYKDVEIVEKEFH